MEKIKAYLESNGLHGAMLGDALADFERHEDIAKEFEKWIETGEDGELAVEGYTAKNIRELAPFMNGCGVYSFLITLRERPEVGKKYITEKFVQK